MTLASSCMIDDGMGSMEQKSCLEMTKIKQDDKNKTTAFAHAHICTFTKVTKPSASIHSKVFLVQIIANKFNLSKHFSQLCFTPLQTHANRDNVKMSVGIKFFCFSLFSFTFDALFVICCCLVVKVLKSCFRSIT